MRGRGTGCILKILGKDGKPLSRFWYIQYYTAAGRQVRESTKSETKQVAESLLRTRLQQVDAGIDPAKAFRLKYEDIRKGLMDDYEAQGHRMLKILPPDENGERKRTICSLAAADDYFAGWAVKRITSEALQAFVDERREAGVRGPTINRSLAAIRRMFTLARKKGQLNHIPYFPMQKESEPREGFVTDQQFEKIRSYLPQNLWPLVTFLFYTAVRVGEAKQITWSQVHLAEKEIRLEGRQTKNGHGRIAPLSEELVIMLRKMFQADGPVFDATNLRKEWAKATKQANMPRLLIHDLRRSAIRNLMDAGAQEKVAMTISGHRTRSVFDRYNIVSTEQIHKAMKAREEGARQNKAKYGASQP